MLTVVSCHVFFVLNRPGGGPLFSPSSDSPKFILFEFVRPFVPLALVQFFSLSFDVCFAIDWATLAALGHIGLAGGRGFKVVKAAPIDKVHCS